MTELVLDIGNQRIKAGIFQDNILKKVAIFPVGDVKEILNLGDQYSPVSVIMSSTSVLEQEMAKAWNKLSTVMILDHTLPLPIRNDYATPKTLGKDRLAGAVAAAAKFPGEPVLVVDAGTCVTYDLVDAENSFKGGYITPGLRMRFQAMHDFTARLPRVEPAERINLYGRTTEDAMRSGTTAGLVEEVRGLIRRFRRSFPGLHVILTGGDGFFLSKQLKSEIFVEPNLVLEGLHRILRFNLSL
ncbi:MAG: type III pantothenate kinase [Lewinellaceae bacterium]|nr:type III pantothenate kinase [Lewinellaceae bacterium]